MAASGARLGAARGIAAWSAAGALALAGAAALTWLSGAAILGGLLGAGFATAVGAAALALSCRRQASELAERADKLSDEIDTLSRRLLALEARATAGNPPGEAALRSSIQEMTSEMGVLGALVRDLAETLAAQDRELAALKEELAREAPPRPALPAASSLRAAAPRAPAAEAGGAATTPALLGPERPLTESRAGPKPLPAALETLGLDALVASRASPATVDAAEARRVIAIREAFAADRIELHLQPVVALPQRRVRLYETLARLRLADDTLLVPAEFLPVLERCGLSPELDRKVLLRAAAIARHLSERGSETALSVNLAPVSLAKPGFLRAVGRMTELYPDLAGRLVLEAPQRSWRTLDAETAGALAHLRDAGVPFALDRASDLRMDPLALAERGVRYVKVPADMLLRPEGRQRADVETRDLAAILARAGISLVAERVEREEDVPDLIDLDVPLAQGFLFAAPRPVRPETLAGHGLAPPREAPIAPEPALGPDATRAEPPEADPPGERRPFRAFLRRAS